MKMQNAGINKNHEGQNWNAHGARHQELITITMWWDSGTDIRETLKPTEQTPEMIPHSLDNMWVSGMVTLVTLKIVGKACFSYKNAGPTGYSFIIPI